MIQMQNDITVWLQQLSGQELRSVNALLFIFDGVEEIDHPQAVSLTFSTSENCVLKCASDGESMQFSRELLMNNDMGEFGKQLVRDVSACTTWHECIDKQVFKTYLLESECDKIVGVGFSFDSEISIFVMNLGDELYIFDRIEDCLAADPDINARVII